MKSQQRHSKREPCPVCDGYPELPQGKGVRCWGFISGDDKYIVCSREDHGGGMLPNSKTGHWHHKATGNCHCGTVHAPDPGTLHDIGEARGSAADMEQTDAYVYEDAQNNPVKRVRRLEGDGGRKSFRQDRRDGENWISGLVPETPDTLYRLPQVLRAIAAGDTVYVVEGEKDVHSCEAKDLVATTNAGGALKWKDHYAEDFSGATVVIVQDKDEPGRKHAREVFASMKHNAEMVFVVEAKIGKDATDHFGAGLTVDEFEVVYPVSRESDPVRWRQVMIDKAQDTSDPLRFWDNDVHLPESPLFPSGLGPEGAKAKNMVKLVSLTGTVILSGKASSGKSFLALASAIDAAREGYDVLWLNAEMAQSVLQKRLRWISGDDIPRNLRVVEVGYGASVPGMIALVREHVGKALLVTYVDSLSSYIDQGLQNEGQSDDHMGMGPLRYAMMAFINARRLTNGDLSFVLLSEANAAGETKGRFGDHKADLSINMASDKESPHCKRITIVKAWSQSIGPLGLFTIEDETGRYKWVGD